MTQPGYDVFISHKSEYKPWVIWLAEALQASGRSVFLDIWNLIPGENWLEGLHRGVQQCRAAVLVATPEVVNSGWVRDEYNALKSRRENEPGFRLIPIVFGELPDLPFLGNLQAVDFRDTTRFRESLHKLICGLEGREPGKSPQLNFDPPPPPTITLSATAQPVPSEQQFVERVMGKLRPSGSPPVMVASRGQRHQGKVIARLLNRARQEYGERNVIRLTPPFAPNAAADAFFGELGRQCGAPAQTPDSTAFMAAIEHHLGTNGNVFLQITGFESATVHHRIELASALRSLCERQPDQLRIVLVGGARLVEQKFGQNHLSALNIAELLEWPDPTAGDVAAWSQDNPAGGPLGPDEIQPLLDATGGHAGLVRHCLEQRALNGKPACWDAWSYNCPEVWETWNHLAGADAEALKASLDRDSFGPLLPWPLSPAARRLYWADLLKPNKGQLVWRTAQLRQIGREVLA
ncbi:toll/interleukin-1 receptor domain-containing protein [uncultured Zoogloea sp.]|uniref:toll/interleukin-1 receptor domain-containing protein n=1 Tax=uncultured Zoogloea sp. TaxID=160237 RepID=UPI00261AD9E1|nr:toll/interleukin-1 receptor domain-containing protein [uncultured Zoogloea sp.]